MHFAAGILLLSFLGAAELSPMQQAAQAAGAASPGNGYAVCGFEITEDLGTAAAADLVEADHHGVADAALVHRHHLAGLAEPAAWKRPKRAEGAVAVRKQSAT